MIVLLILQSRMNSEETFQNFQFPDNPTRQQKKDVKELVWFSLMLSIISLNNIVVIVTSTLSKNSRLETCGMPIYCRSNEGIN